MRPTSHLPQQVSWSVAVPRAQSSMPVLRNICPGAEGRGLVRRLKSYLSWDTYVGSMLSLLSLPTPPQLLCKTKGAEQRSTCAYRPARSPQNATWRWELGWYRGGCWNKSPQMEGLKTTEIYSPTVLEARDLESWCWQGFTPSRRLQKRSHPSLLPALDAPCIPWLVATSRHLCLCLYTAASSSGCPHVCHSRALLPRS